MIDREAKLLDMFQEEYQLFVNCLFIKVVLLTAGLTYLREDFEIPCILTFVANNHKEGRKAKQLIEDTLSVEVCQVSESGSY